MLFLPALGVPISYYRPFLELWAAAGYRVFGLELRGMPHSSITNVRSTDFGYHHSLAFDIPAALDALPGPPAVLAGHSLGGQLALLFAATHPELTTASGRDCERVVVSRHRWQAGADAASVAVRPPPLPLIVRTLGYFPGHRLGFGGRQPSSVMRDWSSRGANRAVRARGQFRSTTRPRSPGSTGGCWP